MFAELGVSVEMFIGEILLVLKSHSLWAGPFDSVFVLVVVYLFVCLFVRFVAVVACLFVLRRIIKKSTIRPTNQSPAVHEVCELWNRTVTRVEDGDL